MTAFRLDDSGQTLGCTEAFETFTNLYHFSVTYIQNVPRDKIWFGAARNIWDLQTTYVPREFFIQQRHCVSREISHYPNKLKVPNRRIEMFGVRCAQGFIPSCTLPFSLYLHNSKLTANRMIEEEPASFEGFKSLR
jgi:hypothetical protein